MKCLMKILHKGKKKKAGFTLVELMIVVIVVGILAAAAIPIYWWAMAKAYSSEARALLGAIRSVEQIYYAEHDNWYILGTGTYASTLPDADDDFEDDIGVKAHHNKWWHANSLGWKGATDPSGSEGTADTGDPLKTAWVLADGSVYGSTSPIYKIRIAIGLHNGEFLVSYDSGTSWKVE